MSDELARRLDDANIRRVTRDGVTYFSLVDICAIFSDTENEARRYWNDTKSRLEKDGFELSDKIGQFKMPAKDGKMRLTDVADPETCLRIVQSIPSPKAEPIREALAAIAHEYLKKTARRNQQVAGYRKLGHNDEWIVNRFDGIVVRKDFMDVLKRTVVDMMGGQYGAATNEMYRGLYNGRDANDLRRELNIPGGKTPRDRQPLVAQQYNNLCETICTQLLEQRQEVDTDTAMEIIRQVSRMFGLQIANLSNALGYDVATGRPLLKDGRDE